MPIYCTKKSTQTIFMSIEGTCKPGRHNNSMRTQIIWIRSHTAIFPFSNCKFFDGAVELILQYVKTFQNIELSISCKIQRFCVNVVLLDSLVKSITLKFFRIFCTSDEHEFPKEYNSKFCAKFIQT